MANARLPPVHAAMPAAVRDDAPRTPWRHGVALWFLVIAGESMNGSLRELVLEPRLGAAIAGRIGFATATLLALGIAWFFARWMQATGLRAQLQVGLLWAVLTLAFDAVVARATHLSLDAFLGDYDPSRGGLMAFGLLVLLVAPAIGARMAGIGRTGHPAH